jgi:hypothetical protein
MATRKPTDTKHADALPGEAEMARVYRAAAQDAPPASLDARILAEAQRAVDKPKARGLFGGHWAIPLSTAAVIVLSLGVPMVAEAPLQAPARSAPSAPAPSEPAQPAAEAPAKAKSALSVTAQGVVAPQTALSSAPEAKKTERAAPARDAVSATGTLAKEASSMNVQADVIAVQASGQPGAYQFNVGIRSPDKGCAQYADWWEVVSMDGKLLYRRVLLHSHVDEQPFTRSGGPVPIQADTVVWVRAHMNTGGYGGVAFKGSVKAGFKQAVPDAQFATGLAKQAPLPDGCDF